MAGGASLRETLQRSVGAKVIVRLKWDKSSVLTGTLSNFDENMNLMLEGAEERGDEGPITRYGTVLVRGSSICLIQIRSVGGVDEFG